jgi:hypothetical protein
VCHGQLAESACASLGELLEPRTPKRKRTRRRKDREFPDLATALHVAEVLWPEFVLEDGATFVKSERDGAPQSIEQLHGRLTAEWFVNHTHVFDKFAHGASLRREPWYNRRHPDFARACRLAEIMCETWAAKLRRDFPEDEYAVFCTRDDNPIVRFHKIRAPDDIYFNPLDHPTGTVLMIRSHDGRHIGEIRPPSASTAHRSDGVSQRVRRRGKAKH